MVTMKDVAKLAGVSHGTVSNVVNGVKNVSVDKIKKVEAAMEALGYKPNLAARNLKMEYTRQIDLVVPNMISGEFLELYEAVRTCGEKKNYTINLRVTDGIPSKERRFLNESIMNHTDGVILVTCQPANLDFFEDVIKRGLRIVFCIADLNGSNCNFVGVDISDAIEEIIISCRRQGKKAALITGDAESSYHDNLISSYCKGMILGPDNSEKKYMEIIQVSPEYAAKGAAKLFQLSPRPDVVIVSNEAIAREIHKMSYLLEGKSNGGIKVVVFGGGKRTPYFEDELIQIPFKTVGRAAFESMLKLIQGKTDAGNERILIQPLKHCRKEENTSAVKAPGRRLKILLNDSPSSDAVKALLPNFTRNTGIEAEVITKKFSEIYDMILRDQYDQEYDIYSIDIPWMNELANRGVIAEIDAFADKNRECMELYSKDILRAFSQFDGHIYAIPYGFAVQLLFYRKDLFEKIKNQRLYYEWYKEELRVPQTWEEFNKVGRLFTKKYNPDSETPYGVTMGGSGYSGAGCEFLPRLWMMGAGLYENGEVLPQQKKALKALKNYMESFSYADPEAVNWWWNEQVREFMKGNAAMMVMFTEHASALVEKNCSKVAGKYQVATLPGKMSVRGGWSLAARKNTRRMWEVYEFFKWISDPGLLEENAILGRIYPVTDTKSVECVDEIYNWYNISVNAFGSARPRNLPVQIKRDLSSEVLVENVVGRWVHEAVTGNLSAEEALAGIKKSIEAII